MHVAITTLPSINQRHTSMSGGASRVQLKGHVDIHLFSWLKQHKVTTVGKVLKT